MVSCQLVQHGERHGLMSSTLHYVGSVVTNIWSWLLGAIVALAALYWNAAPDALRAVLQAVAVCTVADTVLGVVAAFSCPQRKFSSHALSTVINKLFVYCMTLLAAFGVDLVVHHIVGATALFQLVVGSMIVFREMSSVLEFSALLGVKWPSGLQRKLDLARKKVEGCFDDELTAESKQSDKGKE